MIIQLCGWNLTWQRIFSYGSWCDSLTAGSQVLNAWRECFDFFSKTGRIFSYVLCSCKQKCKDFRKWVIEFYYHRHTSFYCTIKNILTLQVKESIQGLYQLLSMPFDQCQRPQQVKMYCSALTYYGYLTSFHHFWQISATTLFLIHWDNIIFI